MIKKNLLGIFDSGIGGFSVYKEVRLHTHADIIYFGDCARAPYGNKTEQEIVTYIREILRHLQEQGVTYFVSACNSMSVFTTKQLLKEVGIPESNYFDMVSAVEIIPFTPCAKVLIVGTKATIASGVYQQILESKNISYEVYSPVNLAGSIERGDISDIRSSILEVIQNAIEANADSILYACTHYPLAHDIFLDTAKKYAWNGEYIDPAVYLGQLVKMCNLEGSTTSTFLTSLTTEAFTEQVKKHSL
jgi:glutamate racemase